VEALDPLASAHMASKSKRRKELARDLESFDPLAIPSLQELLRGKLEAQEPEDFPPEDFIGAGVYALYYVGDMELYKPLVESDCGVPIYVGKAEAGNSSTGEPTDPNGLQLVNRIQKHAKSVQEASMYLSVEDFRVRYLPMDDAWIVLAERALLRDYRPVLWNVAMTGFGSNPPGTERKNARSIWDTIHPGRDRAGTLCNRRFTHAEMHERAELAIAASVQTDENKKERLLKKYLDYKRPKIWQPRDGKPILVTDKERFESEMERLGLPLPEYEIAEGGEATHSDDDPEIEAEANTRVAERLAEEG